MLRATFLVPYPTGLAPGQRFRLEQWLRLLPERSVHADVRPLFTAAAYSGLYEPGHSVRKASQTIAGFSRRLRDILTVPRPDIVLLYRGAFPLGPPILDWLVEHRFKVVYDFDDAIYLGGTSEANRAVSFLKMPSKTNYIVSWATAILAGNANLAAYAQQFNPAVHVMPTTVDVDQYRPPPVRTPEGEVRIGWSGSPTTAPHLASISGALQRVLRRLPARLDVVGAPAFRLEGFPELVGRAWKAETEIADVGAFDIGLMPLPDDEWSRGKCGFKALLYMALGVPVVVSPVGVNTEIVEDGVNGLLASSEDEWVEAITRLADDPALRRRLAAEGRRTVVDRYSGQRWAPRFLELLESVAATPR